MAKAMDKHATIDGEYRYRLVRRWEPRHARDVALFVMLNPSTADAFKDDPTIRKCIGFAQMVACNAILVVNLFAYRATDPDDLARADARGVDIIGKDNDAHIIAALADKEEMVSVVIPAWAPTVKTTQTAYAPSPR